MRYRAELHTAGGSLDVLEAHTRQELRKLIAHDWIPVLWEGDVIKMIDKEDEIGN